MGCVNQTIGEEGIHEPDIILVGYEKLDKEQIEEIVNRLLQTVDGLGFGQLLLELLGGLHDRALNGELDLLVEILHSLQKRINKSKSTANVRSLRVQVFQLIQRLPRPGELQPHELLPQHSAEY